ncbi:hypothetical protein PPSIR1_33089 [Plesiocystis pacifica SIR-1]|uniref:Uncharacterized protein n=1 Tax=Plesiocystis pacifica SIR-1 TaxID=391625 RepID=A6GJ49_9BACT|nr:hypothetical protein PPSIR1_33089 [Plesiocystis pacifica SIR-1]
MVETLFAGIRASMGSGTGREGRFAGIRASMGSGTGREGRISRCRLWERGVAVLGEVVSVGLGFGGRWNGS